MQFGARAGQAALEALVQDGCLKARFPRQQDTPGKTGVLINTAGGIADGDILDIAVRVGCGADVVMTSQAAERVYKARNMAVPSRLHTVLGVEKAATLYWLPQETILFDGGAIARRYDADIAQGGRCLMAEMLVFGRVARGEVIEKTSLFDRWRIRLDGRLVFADGFRLSGGAPHTYGTARLKGVKAIATLLFIGPEAAFAKARLRDSMEDAGCHAACSERGGVLIARFAGAEPHTVREAMMAAIALLDEGKDMASPVLSRWIF
ncbi:urease accessory protein UreD [Kordiimonas aestuarii]|uniref:urease accessory protein UreD n=1 Tax=Kordiimonas aestuarii TaxID=1005925 RepID=UPI0021D03B52|nr:urease accessory protein UreD [Kordiimonas aestuarii]